MEKSGRFQVIKDGLITGIIGYATVAILYVFFDLLAARGFLYTVNLLGQALFMGLRDPAVLLSPMELDITAIFLYNTLHLIIALIIGMIVIGLVDFTERQPSKAQRILFFLFLGFVITVASVGYLTSSIRPLLPWWSIVIANILSIILAGFYLLKKHPGIGPHLILLMAKLLIFPHRRKPSS